VTLLTSVSSQDMVKAGYADEYASDPERLVLKKAGMAKAAGFAGVVCSGREVRTLKEIFGKDFLAVTPGIRPADDAAPLDDQKRVVTPAAAIHNGAEFLVVGRPIRDADDPAGMASHILEEIAACLER
jgi:orotidine-5'-phosphate decarboxylase